MPSDARARTRRGLIDGARRLTADRGLTGFTVQELCDSVGVSRRTFFNYFSTKEDAVLGVSRGADDEHIATFMAGGSGDLLADLADLAVAAFDEMGLTPAGAGAIRSILRTEPSLFALILDSAEQQQERYVSMVARREELGSDRETAEVAVKLVGAMVGLSAETFLSETNTRPFDVILRDRLATASLLLNADQTRTRAPHPRPEDQVLTP